MRRLDTNSVGKVSNSRIHAAKREEEGRGEERRGGGGGGGEERRKHLSNLCYTHQQVHIPELSSFDKMTCDGFCECANGLPLTVRSCFPADMADTTL